MTQKSIPGKRRAIQRRRTSSFVKALLFPPWLLRKELYVSSRGYLPAPQQPPPQERPHDSARPQARTKTKEKQGRKDAKQFSAPSRARKDRRAGLAFGSCVFLCSHVLSLSRYMSPPPPSLRGFYTCLPLSLSLPPSLSASLSLTFCLSLSLSPSPFYSTSPLSALARRLSPSPGRQGLRCLSVSSPALPVPRKSMCSQKCAIPWTCGGSEVYPTLTSIAAASLSVFESLMSSTWIQHSQKKKGKDGRECGCKSGV